MPSNPFESVLEMPEAEGRLWLASYLLGKAVDPPLPVPFDLGRLEFLLGHVARLPDRALPAHIGELAGGLLAEAVMAAPLRKTEPRLLQALFIIVEALPASEAIVRFLTRLAVAGPLLPWPEAEGPDFHLLTLRALVLHQPRGHRDERLVELWRDEIRDLRYASIAIQGLLRLSPTDAIDELPDFVERALAATPPIRLGNLAFALAVALVTDIHWDRLAGLAFRHPRAFAAIREGLRKTRLPHINPRAWDILQGSSDIADGHGVYGGFGSVGSPLRASNRPLRRTLDREEHDIATVRNSNRRYRDAA